MSIKSNSKSVAGIRRMSLLSLIVLFGLALAASAQTFSSGSNGSDGAFEPTGPAGTVINFVPANFARKPAQPAYFQLHDHYNSSWHHSEDLQQECPRAYILVGKWRRGYRGHD